ncbi:Na+/H+ antiporter NhaA [Streptomyces avidinii]|uniref:Na+/H+ antiporter NhaA n=1 Tax=Streptomyces avidinii TaxID=1895 RepID=UPI0037B332A9
MGSRSETETGPRPHDDPLNTHQPTRQASTPQRQLLPRSLLLQHFRVRGWWWYVPLGLTIWTLTYNSGVHATVAGVAMGRLLRATPGAGEESSVGGRSARLLRPVSAAVAVPLFALFAAGVPLWGEALTRVFTTPEPLGVVAGLVAGKVIGVFGGAWLAARFTHAQLNPELSWADVLGLAGISFTIALLFGELAFPGGANAASVKAAVLIASLISAATADAVLRRRNAICRYLSDEEEHASDNGRDRTARPLRDGNGVRRDRPAVPGPGGTGEGAGAGARLGSGARLRSHPCRRRQADRDDGGDGPVHPAREGRLPPGARPGPAHGRSFRPD